MKLKYIVRLNCYSFVFETAKEAVSFAIAAKVNNTDRTDEVSIDFVELEEENAIRESDNEEAAQSSETEK